METLLIIFTVVMLFVLIYMIHGALILFEEDINWLKFKTAKIFRKNKKIKK